MENTLIPGVDITDTGEKLGRGPVEVPKSPVFDGSDVSYPSWSQNFPLSAQHINLYEEFVSKIELPIAAIGFDLTPGYRRVSMMGVIGFNDGCDSPGGDGLVVSVRLLEEG